MGTKACERTIKNISIIKDTIIPDKVSQYFSFLNEKTGTKGAIAKKIKDMYLVRLAIEPGKIDEIKVFNDLDSFVKTISRGTFDTMKDLQGVSDVKLEDEINRYLSAFSDIATSILNSNDIEFLNKNTEMINHYNSTRSLLMYSANIAKAEKWAENPVIKWLTLNPFTQDRGAKFMSNPLIKPAYDELLKLNSSVNNMTNISLDKKERLLLRATELGISDTDLGSIVKVMEVSGSIIKEKEIPRENQDQVILTELKYRFDDVNEGFVAKVKDIWSEYMKFNYGSSIGETLFNLPKDYDPLLPKYSDGFLPMFINSNVQMAKLNQMIKATRNVNTNSEFIKGIMEATDLFIVKDGKIEWKWQEQYFPNHKVFSNETVLVKNEVYRSLDEANALHRSKEKLPEELDFVNSLNSNIENIRHRTNLSATRLFTSYLSGISGYKGDTSIAKDLLLNTEQNSVYRDWVEAGSGQGLRSNHGVIKEYIDRMTDRFDTPINIDEMKSNSLFKKTLMAGVGLAAALPLSGSAVNNLAGAASQMANELGLKDSFTLITDWFSEHPPGSTEAIIKDAITEKISESHGVKLKKYSAVEYNVIGTEANGISKVIDEIANAGIKTGQIVSEQGVLSPIALVLETLKGSIDLINTKANMKIGNTTSVTLGKVLELGKNNILSMTGSEDLILNVESAIKYNMISNAIRLRNIGLTSSGKNVMNDVQLKQFVKEYSNDILAKSEIMDKWKRIVGDFSSNTKPFWSWLDLQDATSKSDITKAVIKQTYGMFRGVGLFVTQGALRGTAKTGMTLLSMGKNEAIPGRRKWGYAVLQTMLSLYQLSSKAEGLDIPVVSQLNPATSMISSYTTLDTMVKIFAGANVKEDEFKSMYNVLSRTMGGIPFGGTIQRVAEGWLGDSTEEFLTGLSKPGNITKGLENLIDDFADPFYMVKSIKEITMMNDESINRLNSYRKEYSSNGIPMLNTLTAMNKPMRQMIEGSRILFDMINANVSDEQKLSNQLLRDAQKNLTTLVMSGIGLNSYVKMDAEEANGKANTRKAKMKYDAKYRTGWEGLFK